MATIKPIKGPNGTVWRAWVRVAGIAPQSRRFATQREAREWATDLESKMRTGRLGSGYTTLRELIERFCRECLGRYSDTHRPILQSRLEAWKEALGDRPADRITAADVAAVRGRLVDDGASGTTANHYVTALSAVFTAAWREWQIVPEHPLRGLRRLPEPQGRLRFLTEEEIPRLLAACRESTNPLLYPAVVLSLATGMRRGELRRLQWEHVDLQRGVIRLEVTKTKRRRSVPLIGEALEVLRRLSVERRQVTTFVFPSHDGRQGMDLRVPWENARAKAGLVDFHWHDLRHTAASYLVMSGAHLRTVGEILGHASMATTMRYAHLSPEHLAKDSRAAQAKMFGTAPDLHRDPRQEEINPMESAVKK